MSSDSFVNSSPGLPNSLGDYSSGDYDPEFECDAPKFADLLRQNSSPGHDDAWFDQQQDTPFSVRKYDVDPLLDSFDNDEDEDFDKTPVGAKTPDEPRYLDENTPTPKPKRWQGQENTVNHLTSQMSNLRMKPFTPVKPSKLCHSTTWEDLKTTPKKDEEETKTAHLIKAKTFVPTRSTKPLTVPVEFKFAQRKPIAKVINQQQQTQNKPIATQKKTGKITVPKPFVFHHSSKQEKPPAHSPYVPLAVKVKEFDRTPDRFKPLAKAPPPPTHKQVKPRVTRPISPKFQSRGKKSTVLPTEEQILEEIKGKEQFKARPLDLRILQSHGDLGVPRVKKAAVTIPHSPKFSKLKSRPQTTSSENNSSTTIRAHPYVPPKPFQPKIEHREIKPTDFRLPGSEISERKRQQFMEKMKKEEEEKLKAIKQSATISSSQNHPVMIVKSKAPVDPKSPALQTKLRGQRHQEEFRRKTEEEMRMLKEMANFKAQPTPDLDTVFIPKHSDRPLTEAEPIVLHTQVRVEERKQFDMMIKEQEEIMEALKAQRQQEEELREREEIRKLRKLGEFKAHPLKQSIPFEPKKSDKPLTEPESPFIGDKRRLLMRNADV